MILRKAEDVTPAVQRAMAGASDARLRTLMASLVSHLHDFVRETRPTEAEFEKAIEFVVGLGQATNATHNEAVLFADAVGISTLVCLLNNGMSGAPETAAALLGPFWRKNAPSVAKGGSIVRCDTPGEALFVNGRVRDPAGQSLADVSIDVWQASPAGMYENQDAGQADMNLRGTLQSDADGVFAFRTVKPSGYPVPTHGPVGGLLRAQARSPMRPAHIHFLLHKPGFKTLITQVFVADDQYLENDVVFGVTDDLVGNFIANAAGTPAPAADVSGTWHSLDHVFVMEPGESVLPHPPIA